MFTFASEIRDLAVHGKAAAEIAAILGAEVVEGFVYPVAIQYGNTTVEMKEINQKN